MIGENTVLRDRESAGLADGLRIAGEIEGARIEGLGLNVSGADKQEMIGSEGRMIAWGNLDSISFGFAKHSQFNSGWLMQLTGGVEKVLTVGEEGWSGVINFILVEMSGRRDLATGGCDLRDRPEVLFAEKNDAGATPIATAAISIIGEGLGISSGDANRF